MPTLNEPQVALDDEQLHAVEMVLREPVSVITGPPGTGKTTILREVIARAEATGAYPATEVLLTAPTGRAARQMAEATGAQACTIHRLLEYHPQEGFRRNGDVPLDGKLLCVDESSMVDLPLMAALLEAVPEEMRLVLVGDADQLPPVGPGAPFQDLIRSGAVPVTRLAHIYRQGAGSIIPRNAARINAGELPIAEEGNPAYTHAVYPRGERERMAQDVLAAVRRLLTAGYVPDDVQVLVPLRKGPLGTVALNQALRDVLNPGGKGEFQAGGSTFCIGDRVMQVRNDYEKGIFNGEIGKVVRFGETEIKDPVTGRRRAAPAMFVAYDEGTGKREVAYSAGEAAGDLQLAYASTVHKGQGGQFPAVVMALGWDAYLLLRRNLVYTGLTRARETVVMITEAGALEAAIMTPGAEERHSALVQRLRAG
jgi:exodeoxyribonuclease V alpha subunit